ncbi:MAG: YraN family protein [Anaerolineales bacterium]|nr:YraN family protein [Anaerolineales bacterium]
MSDARVRLGRRGEDLAARRLVELGYTVVGRNYRCPHGELDLIARHGDVLVFVEVRTRRSARFGTPEESITPRKQAHLIAAAQHYLQAHALADVPWRIDAVAITVAPGGRVTRLGVIENAVSG